MTEFERRVRWALAELERGDFATSSRDYGRGVAFACQHIRDSIGAEQPSIITYTPEEIAMMDDFAGEQNDGQWE